MLLLIGYVCVVGMYLISSNLPTGEDSVPFYIMMMLFDLFFYIFRVCYFEESIL